MFTWQFTSQCGDASRAFTPALLPWMTAKCSGVLLFLLSHTFTFELAFNITVTVSPLRSLTKLKTPVSQLVSRKSLDPPRRFAPPTPSSQPSPSSNISQWVRQMTITYRGLNVHFPFSRRFVLSNLHPLRPTPSNAVPMVKAGDRYLSWFTRTRFPALGTSNMHLLRVLIGSLHCLPLLWLARVIALVLVLRHSIENFSCVTTQAKALESFFPWCCLSSARLNSSFCFVMGPKPL